MSERDDTNLRSLICPHCKQAAHVFRVDVSDELTMPQLVYLKCPKCGEGITKDEITDAYREYRPE